MSTPKIGKPVKDFRMSITGDKTIKLSDLKGRNVVLYFYPKDATPGCTIEGQNFRDNLPKFKRQNTVVLGVSRDSLASHEKFRDKQKFKFELVSDIDEKLCKMFDVIK